MIITYKRDLTEVMDAGWNFRDECELFYARSGSVRLIASDGIQAFTIREGEGVFIPPLVISNMVASSGSAVAHSLIFPSAILFEEGDNIVPSILSSSPPFVSLSASSAITIERAYATLESDVFLSQLEAESLILSLMVSILREIGRGVWTESTSNERLRRMMEYVKAHYGEKVTLSDIASSAFVSERECQRIFAKSLSVSPMQYLISYRLREAELLLRSSDLPISDIAYRTGFESSSHFAYSFKKRFGITPKEARRL